MFGNWKIAFLLLIGWPERVSIRTLPSEKGGSTLAIYSRSVYGQSDFGTNKSRIGTSLSTLENAF
ncbi:MAG: DUF1499 domain-containing protein [Sneathiella sp.]|nr:DUF1499 domain-containing protein [Sneathiella sp.]